MKKTIVAIALTIPLLVGCAEVTDDTSPKTGSNASVTPETEAAQTDEEATDEAADDEAADAGSDTLAFGETATFEDGISVTVGKPQKFQPTEWASFDKAPSYVKFKVTIVNGTDAAYDASGAFVTVQSGDLEAGEVFDTERGLDGSPMTKVLPGRQSSYWVGFGVQTPKDIVMDFQVDWDHDAAVFTNVPAAG